MLARVPSFTAGLGSPYDSRGWIYVHLDEALEMFMCHKRFLSSEHRNCERPRNVLGKSRSYLMNDDVQNLILNIDHHSQKSAELHASALFPEAFGPLSDADVHRYLNKKHPRGQWTRQRNIPTAGTSMVFQEERNTAQVVEKARKPKASLLERRLALNWLMKSLTLAKHKAKELGDSHGAEYACKRWNMLYSARHLLSPYADAYKSLGSTVRHANTSQLLPALNLEFLTDVEEPSTSSVSDATCSYVQRPQTGRRNVPTITTTVCLGNFGDDRYYESCLVQRIR